MKLSMWIIANLLEAFEPEVHVREESPRVLRSARMVYATNCVVVKQEGSDCLYTWEDDVIRMPDLSLREGFELLQSLFDIMFDWQGQIEDAIDKKDFHLFVELCNIVFRNPIMLTDANHACIACSERYSADSVDEEWRHVKTYGYSSFTSPRKLAEAQLTYHINGEVVRFNFRPGSEMCNNISISISYNNRPVGYMSVIEKDHPLNDGHMQVLVMLAHMLAVALGKEQKRADLNVSLLQRFLKGEDLSDESTVHFLDQRGWNKEHYYRIYAISFQTAREDASFRGTYQHYLSAVSAVFPSDLCGIRNDMLVLLANDTILDDRRRRERLNGLFRGATVLIGVSLSVRGFALMPRLLEQAVFSLSYETARSKEGIMRDFYDIALDYLIRTPYSPDRCLAACHPDVYRLYKQDDAMYMTFMTYLTNDCSVNRTAQAMFVHKNTILYRLRRIEEGLIYDMSDPYTQLYMRMSFELLDHHAGTDVTE